ncbi:PP2C family protein-serine/threonine phosphatase [Peterkaempfera griseoplana]|uniref:PP2C family protein-serine/threonine phosphatase n=1 Tax=Peterkaempfera griseoplana TaxID=66896 RepID=UPI0006E1D973|nr:PP2C family protein-serine/threonine phosphatase [Peterkaempfera griseoplana]
MDHAAQIRQMLGGLLRASRTTSLEHLPELLAEHAAGAGLQQPVIFVSDIQQQVLRQLTGRGQNAGAGGAELTVDGTLAGRAYQRVEVVPDPVGEAPGGKRWWIPVTDGVVRMGVLRVDTATPDEETLAAARDLAALTALLLVSRQSFSDSYARLIRTAPMGVGAEMDWQVTPPPAYAGDGVAVSAVMEPAYDVSGDAFDFAVCGPLVHLAIFDAMGHDTAAGITAGLAVAACRCARRRDAPLTEVVAAVDAAVLEQFAATRFVTGIIAELNAETGRLSWVNSGHHPPVVVREGRWPTELSCPPAAPLGMGLGMDLAAVVCHEQLQPGDRLLFFTDGIIEARDADGREFGLERLVDELLRHCSCGLGLHETLRRLARAVIDQRRLTDDATALLVEWHGRAEETLVV